ncbi:MAG: adenylate/guanylate cyclase domain-containing protein [Desulfosarcina sp.]|nr:adenylate/guanylate cyclase domain-containing protein [Desulfosarcina sp.]MBC2742512.1 adenylate/guanylate cyclase domain-containing protein [Desulfosarcina sp.]MBC2765422.1 adenylate/guanylate cyclase domain-containing protein [Desulfosarcina sp.]
MSRSVKTIGISLGAGLLGVILSIPPFSLDLQEHLGLKLLFHLRGTRRPASEVIIVTLDRESVEALNLPTKTQRWPRTLHAQLVQTLSRQGATAIIFDLLFDEAHDVDVDNAFVAAVGASENVVLCESIRQDKIPITDSSGQYLADLNIETLVPPIPPLARSALALAPFPLPKVPIQLSQFWMFKAGAGNLPTLPVVAFFIYASSHYDSFYHLFNEVRPDSDPALLPHWDEIVIQRGVEETLIAFREIFNREPSIAQEMLNQIESRGSNLLDTTERKMLTGLIRMFQSENSRYLNFYGPAGTFNTLSYHKALSVRDCSGNTKGDSTATGFEGKIVFVGLSENLRPQRQDGYHTVFSQKNGVDISGVEIAATAFANLLEDRPLTPLKWPMHLFIVFAFGLFLGFICFSLPMGVATVSVIVIGVLYLSIALICFNTQALWIPVVIPLFFLLPLALLGTVVCRYCIAAKEREVIRKAFGYFLPDPVIDQLSKNIGDINANSKVVYGICLYTDAQQYTTLSEAMEPKELSQFMNRYYEKLFVPVKKCGGIVSDVVGDSMMAIWAKSNPDASLRAAACHAALGIVQAIKVFNRENEQIKLHTRIGMHAGHILIGNIGAVDHYEYRPVGDIVNTASRMESMNKHLGTQILVSDQVLHLLDGFMTRELGKFLLFGKSNPVVIYELLGYIKEMNMEQHQLCHSFEEGLNAYRQKSWDGAMDAFARTLSIYRADGPSIFYKKRCEGFKQHPPDENWDGTVVMGQK